MNARMHFITLAFCAAFAGGNVALAEEFRVDTDVYLEGEGKEPIAETLTLFSNGLIYDFILTGSEEITIFDVDRGHIVMLDTDGRYSGRRVPSTARSGDMRHTSSASSSAEFSNRLANSLRVVVLPTPVGPPNNTSLLIRI